MFIRSTNIINTSLIHRTDNGINEKTYRLFPQSYCKFISERKTIVIYLKEISMHHTSIVFLSIPFHRKFNVQYPLFCIPVGTLSVCNRKTRNRKYFQMIHKFHSMNKNTQINLRFFSYFGKLCSCYSRKTSPKPEINIIDLKSFHISSEIADFVLSQTFKNVFEKKRISNSVNTNATHWLFPIEFNRIIHHSLSHFKWMNAHSF